MLSSDSLFVSSVLGLALIGLIFAKKDYILELKDKLLGGGEERTKGAHGDVLKRKHSGTRASTVAWYERKRSNSEMPNCADEKPEKSNLVKQNPDDVPKRKHSGSRASTIAYYERKRSSGESPHDADERPKQEDLVEQKHRLSHMEPVNKQNLLSEVRADVPKRKHSGSRASTIAYYERKRSSGEMQPKQQDLVEQKKRLSHIEPVNTQNLLSEVTTDVPTRKHSGSRESTIAYYERKRSSGE